MASPSSASKQDQDPDTSDPTGETAHAACRQVVRQLRAANQWSLLSEDELVALVHGVTPGSTSRTMREYRARGQYGRALWSACSQGDHDRRELAYAELRRYLYRAAYNRRPALADDAVQRALELVVAHIDRCREPGAFLTFALSKLRQALSEETTRSERVDTSATSEDIAIPDTLPVEQERRELIEALVAALGRLPDARERQVVALKFFDGVRDEAIAARLAITPNHVRVLRHHGLRRMRADPRLIAFLNDDGPSPAP
jgi:RNA polymerase sigma-70 factor (ECF subfamily)